MKGVGVMSKPIDVLTVMDRAAEYVNSESIPVRLARMAVAELLEAINQYQNDYTDDGCPDENCVLCRRSKAADDRLRSAIAKAKGAATPEEGQ